MLEFRRRELEKVSQLNITYVPHNTFNLPDNLDFEYDIVGGTVNAYKVINGNEIHVKLSVMPCGLRNIFYVAVTKANRSFTDFERYSQCFDTKGKPLLREEAYNLGEYLPKYSLTLAKQAIDLYKIVFPDFNYN